MRAALLMWLVACGGDKAPPPEPGPSPTPVLVTPPVVAAPACEPVIRNAATRIATESKRVEIATAIDRTATLMIASCEAEAWPANILTCIATARLDADLDACTEELTYRQHKRLHDKIAQVTPRPAPARPAVARVRIPSRDDLLPLPTATAKVDCSKTLVNPTNTACQKQYCLTHAAETRCMVE